MLAGDGLRRLGEALTPLDLDPERDLPLLPLDLEDDVERLRAPFVCDMFDPDTAEGGGGGGGACVQYRKVKWAH